MNYQNITGFEFNKKFFWIICSICILILVIIIYRAISTQIPKELQDYLTQSHEEYINLKNESKIMEINASSRFSLDNENPLEYSDAMFVERIYYIENAQKLQIVLRCKNTKIQPMILNPEEPFEILLSNYTLNDNTNIAWEDWKAEWTTWSDRLSNSIIFGKSTDKYQYFVYSFDDVVINYATSMVTLQIFANNNIDEIQLNENDKLGQFTIYTGEKLAFLLSH